MSLTDYNYLLLLHYLIDLTLLHLLIDLPVYLLILFHHYLLLKFLLFHFMLRI